jgi:hypothetical protein
MASLPTTAHAKRGGTIPISGAPVCTVVVQATKRSFETPGVTGAGLVQELLCVGASLLAKAVLQTHRF